MTSQPMTAVERVAEAMFTVDWPDDKWERHQNVGKVKGPDHAARRYIDMAVAALAALAPASEEVEKVADENMCDGPTCPYCESGDYVEEDGDHTFPVGDDFGPDGLPRVTAELTVRVPIGKCNACGGQFLDYRSEYVTDAAAKVWREQRATLTAELATLRAQAGEKEWEECAKVAEEAISFA